MIDSKLLHQMFGLQGLVALVTDSGALSSIDVAPVLAAAGAIVVVADKDAAQTQALVESISRAGHQAIAIPANIEDESEVIALFDAIRTRFGRLDILVNCAGMIASQPFVEATTAQFDEIVSINLRSTFMSMREAVRVMLDAGNGGRIINITTMGSQHPVLFGNQIYGATRAGVTMMTRTTAMDYLADKILANVVLPGAIRDKTRLHASTLAAIQGGRAMRGPGVDRNSPLGMLDARDIGAAALYLAGPSGGYITGQAIILDGGFLSM